MVLRDKSSGEDPASPDGSAAEVLSIASDDTMDETIQEPSINIHVLPDGDGAIVSIVPASSPSSSTTPVITKHVPVDIVLVIDVSGSMHDAAPAPGDAKDTAGTREDFGLSVLDLTKHAARTIMETLDEDDRLGIVTFSNDAQVLQPLIPMTKENKTDTEKNIGGMAPLSTTNLWKGITHGLEQFQGNNTGRVPALMVLTDGQPNMGNPPKGYVARLRDMSPLPATIHTFGFGYSLDSCLLKAIAEVGSGNFAFIPDAGMIGTVFIHAVAHLQTTYATKCTLEIKTPATLKLKTTSGPVLNGPISDDDTVQKSGSHNILTLDLGNLQYGQSRDIYLEYDEDKPNNNSTATSSDVLLSATLRYSFMGNTTTTPTTHSIFAEKPLLMGSTPDKDEDDEKVPVVAYHKSRAMLCDFLGSFFERHHFAGYTLRYDPKDLPDLRDKLADLTSTIPANNNKRDNKNQKTQKLLTQLLQDLQGQIAIALSRPEYLSTWAIPFFASLSHAHHRQLCNSFKDPGPQGYNDNDFFRRCRDELDDAFDRIPAPAPSRAAGADHYGGGGGGVYGGALPPPPPCPAAPAPAPRGVSVFGAAPGSSSSSSSAAASSRCGPMMMRMMASAAPPPPPPRRIVNMSAYNNAEGSCFAGETLVQLADDIPFYYHPATTAATRTRRTTPPTRRIPLKKLRAGHRVATPLGPRVVRYIVRTRVRDVAMCCVDGVLVTPWHPVCVDASKPGTWVFPATLVDADEKQEKKRDGKAVDSKGAEEEEEEDNNHMVLRYTGAVYSVMLERRRGTTSGDDDPAGHAILVSSSSSSSSRSSNNSSGAGSGVGIWGVTLGHGIVITGKPTGEDADHDDHGDHDVRAHPFYGDYEAVAEQLGGIYALQEKQRRRQGRRQGHIHGNYSPNMTRRRRRRCTTARRRRVTMSLLKGPERSLLRLRQQQQQKHRVGGSLIPSGGASGRVTLSRVGSVTRDPDTGLVCGFRGRH